MALGTLVGRGFVRIDADTAPAKKAIMALGAIGSQIGLGALASTIAPVTTATLALANSFAVAGGAATAFGAAVVPQFQDISKAMQGQATAEDARTKAAVQASLAQDLAKQSGFKYGKQVEITKDMTEAAKQKAQEYNTALSASQSASKSATTAQALYKQKLDSMPKATRDTATSLTKLKDETNAWSRSLSGSTMPVFTQGINFLRGLLPKLTPLVKSVSGEIKGFVGSLGEGSAGKVFREFGANITKNGAGALRNLLNIVRNVFVGIIGLFNAFTPASKGVSLGLEELTKNFADWSANLGKNKGFQDFLDRMKETGPVIMKALGDLAETITTVITAMGPLAGIGLQTAVAFAQIINAIPTDILKLLAQSIVIVNIGMKLYAIYTAAAAAATWLFATSVTASNGIVYTSRAVMIVHRAIMLATAVATGIATAATWAFNAALAVLTSPITLIVVAVAALIAGIVYLATQTKFFQTVWNAIWKGVSTAFKATVDFIKRNWMTMLAVLGGPLGLLVLFIIKKWDAIKEGAGKAIDAVIDFFKKLPGRILTAVGDVQQTLKRAGEDLLNGMWNGAKAVGRFLMKWFVDRPLEILRAIGRVERSLFQKGVDFLTGLWNGAKQVFDKVRTWFAQRPAAFRNAMGNIISTLRQKGSDLLNGLWNGLKFIYEKVRTWIIQRPAAFRNAIGNVGGTLAQKGRDLLNGLFSGAKAIYDNVRKWFNGRASAVKDAIGKLGETLYQRGRDIISGLFNGLRDRWKDAIDWVKGIKDKIVNAIKSAFGIASPARVMIPLGFHIMAGLMKGLLGSKSVLKSAVRGIFSSVTDVFKNGGKLLGSLVGDLGSSIGLGGPGATGSAQQYAQLYMKSLGFGPSQWPALKALWQAESGWNPLAHNASSGAHGIPQSLPASKMRSEGADYYTNAATQIRWGLKYIKSRYGSPSAAWSFWQRQSPHWYDSGGLARFSGFIPKLTNAPERVLSPRQTALFERMITGKGAQSSGAALIIERLILENHGVIGSRQEVENWLVESLTTLKRKGRLP